jgi:hypothetical protein
VRRSVRATPPQREKEKPLGGGRRKKKNNTPKNFSEYMENYEYFKETGEEIEYETGVDY